MSFEKYTDEQLRDALRAGAISQYLTEGATLGDKIRLLEIVEGDPRFQLLDRQSATRRLAELRPLARLRRAKGRVGAR